MEKKVKKKLSNDIKIKNEEVIYYEYGAHFKYQELFAKLSEIVNNENLNKQDLSSNYKLQNLKIRGTPSSVERNDNDKKKSVTRLPIISRNKKILLKNNFPLKKEENIIINEIEENKNQEINNNKNLKKNSRNVFNFYPLPHKNSYSLKNQKNIYLNNNNYYSLNVEKINSSNNNNSSQNSVDIYKERNLNRSKYIKTNKNEYYNNIIFRDLSNNNKININKNFDYYNIKRSTVDNSSTPFDNLSIINLLKKQKNKILMPHSHSIYKKTIETSRNNKMKNLLSIKKSKNLRHNNIALMNNLSLKHRNNILYKKIDSFTNRNMKRKTNSNLNNENNNDNNENINFKYDIKLNLKNNNNQEDEKLSYTIFNHGVFEEKTTNQIINEILKPLVKKQINNLYPIPFKNHKFKIKSHKYPILLKRGVHKKHKKYYSSHSKYKISPLKIDKNNEIKYNAFYTFPNENSINLYKHKFNY